MKRIKKFIGLGLLVPFIIYTILNFVNMIVYVIKNINTDFAQQIVCLILSLVLFTIGFFILNKK